MTFYPTFMRRRGFFAPEVLTGRLVRAPAVRPEHLRVPWTLPGPIVGAPEAAVVDDTVRWEPLTARGASGGEIVFDSAGDVIMTRRMI